MTKMMTDVTKKRIRMQKIALIYVDLPDCDKQADLAELEGLCATAEAKIVLTAEQKRNSVDPQSVIGIGKIDEIKAAIAMFDDTDDEIDLVLFNVNLSAPQRATLEKSLDKPVIDRIDLILDIFAMRAATAEGKTQVELAQLSYNIATRPDNSKLSRQGGGIGTRGPGETKLETNKRAIRERMRKLREELDKIAAHRDVTRKRRLANKAFVVALVGYTNAGKSTLFNRLCGQDVYADDKLFATLDTTVRRANVDGMELLFTDTVGFINNLPHQLVDAFKSTLEETTYADLVLHVLDVSDKNLDMHIDVTENILAQLNVTAPIVRVYNKCDLPHPYFTGSESLSGLFVSAKTGKGIDELNGIISNFLKNCYAHITLSVPFSDYGNVMSALSTIGATSEPLTDENNTNGITLDVVLRRKYLDKFLQYIVI